MAFTEDTTPTRRRLEGGPFNWQHLTQKQRSAVCLVCELLLEVLDGLSAEKSVEVREYDRDSSSEQGWPVRHKYSQIAFIDGDRGMGKTSVLLTVQDLVQRGAADHSVDNRAVTRMIEQRKNFIWLETIDMEPLPPHANILAAIFARIGLSCGFDSLESKFPVGDYEAENRFQKAITDFTALQSTSVLAWKGMDQHRAAQISPADYSTEVLKTERAGLDFIRRLSSLLADISKFSPHGSHIKGPIFVVPVDDVDMAPERCLEILRLIRMVAIPQLVFVVAGNARIAEDALRLQSEGVLAHLAGEEMTRIETALIRERAMEIAASNLRKLVPPQQRARLEEMTIPEALKVRLRITGPTLSDVLEEVRFDLKHEPQNDAPKSLKEFLLLDESEPGVNYAAAAWLGGTPRRVADRMAVFHDHRGEQEDGGVSLLRMISKELLWEAQEDVQLTYDERERLSDLFDLGDYVRFDFNRVFRLRVETEIVVPREFQNGKSSPEPILRLRSPRPIRWIIRDPRQRGYAAEEGDPALGDWPVPRRIAAGATLLHDLAASLGDGYLTTSPLVHEVKFGAPPAQVLWPSVPESAAVQWHSPQWWTFREHQRFLARWDKYARTCSSLDEHALAWLAAQLEVLLGRNVISLEKAPQVAMVRDLIKQLVAEMAQSSARRNALARNRSSSAPATPRSPLRQDILKSSLVATLLLLAPEAGVSAKLAEDLLEEKETSRSARKAKTGESLAPGKPILASLDFDVAERVRTWRAKTLVRIEDATAHIRIRSEPRELLLLAIKPSIDPAKAAASFQVAFQKFVERPYPDFEPTDTFHSMKQRMEEGKPLFLSEQELEGFYYEINSKGRGSQLRKTIKNLLLARDNPNANHPINRLLNGLLVPTESDIEDLKARQDWLGHRNP